MLISDIFTGEFMTVNCARCGFECETSDAFCRKCGAVLAQEALYTELQGNTALEEVKTVEVLAPATLPSNETSHTEGRALALTKKVGAKVGKAFKSEQGQKLARGATAVAVAVGIELVTQAANRITKTPDKHKLDRPAVSLPDAMLKALEDQLASDQNAVGEEIYIRERLYIRRIMRRPR
jgi:hypothetical protein